eukprot:2896077-Prymnesium_polylepis.1
MRWRGSRRTQRRRWRRRRRQRGGRRTTAVTSVTCSSGVWPKARPHAPFPVAAVAHACACVARKGRSWVHLS